MYKTTDFRGEAHDPLRISSMSKDDILFVLKTNFPSLLKQRNIPSYLSEEQVRSGGVFGTTLPMILVKHPGPPTRFFHIGIVVNNDIISFQLLGESAQNTKANKLDSLRQQGKLMRSWFVKPDEFILQQEIAWKSDVISTVKYLFQEDL